LNVLLSASAFAKQYEMKPFLAYILDLLKFRLDSIDSRFNHYGWSRDETAIFEKILGHAIQHDLSTLRLHALRHAEEHEYWIKWKYEHNEFAPEVQHELQALWAQPPPQKRRKVLV